MGMRFLRFVSVLVAVLALAVPAPGSAAAPGGAVLLDTEFLEIVTHAGGYDYDILAWKDPVAGDDVHVLVSSWGYPEAPVFETEYAILNAGDALTLTRDGNRFTIAFEAVLPKMGHFKFDLTGEDPTFRARTRRLWTFESTSAVDVLVNALSSHQIAGGAGTMFLYAAWGTNATGVVHHAM